MITDKELLDLIDGSLSKDRAEELMKIVSTDPEVQGRFESLKMIDQALSEQVDYNPPVNFVEQVMANLNKQVQLSENGFWKKNLLITISIVAICLIAAVILLSNFSLPALVPDIQPQEITFSQRTISLDPGKLNIFNQDLFVKGIIYLNAFLGIFLLERAVFRPLFKHRRQHYSL